MQTLIALLLLGQSLGPLPQAYIASLPDGWVTTGPTPQVELVTNTGSYVIDVQNGCPISAGQNVGVFYGSGDVGEIQVASGEVCQIDWVTQVSATPCQTDSNGICDINN